MHVPRLPFTAYAFSKLNFLEDWDVGHMQVGEVEHGELETTRPGFPKNINLWMLIQDYFWALYVTSPCLLVLWRGDHLLLLLLFLYSSTYLVSNSKLARALGPGAPVVSHDLS